MTEGRRTKDAGAWVTIRSPCEPDSSGEKKRIKEKCVCLLLNSAVLSFCCCLFSGIA